MSSNGERKLRGYLVGPTMSAELEREVSSYPAEERPARWKAFLRRTRLEAEDSARQKIEALLRDAGG